MKPTYLLESCSAVHRHTPCLTAPELRHFRGSFLQDALRRFLVEDIDDRAGHRGHIDLRRKQFDGASRPSGQELHVAVQKQNESPGSTLETHASSGRRRQRFRLEKLDDFDGELFREIDGSIR